MVTLQTPKQMGGGKILLIYSSDRQEPTFYIYIDGVLIAETGQTQFVVAVGNDENVVVEILDDAEQSPMQVFPGKVKLGWFTVNTSYYRIDEYVDSSWLERKRVNDNNGYMSFNSRFLGDCQNHQFRIVPVGLDGNEGTAREFTILMVRYPDNPDVSYDYSNITHKVTITES